MIISAVDGQYFIEPPVPPVQVEIPVGAYELPGPGIRPVGDLVVVLTMNEDPDERVLLEANFWRQDVSQLVASTGPSWSYRVERDLEVSRALWICSGEREPLVEFLPGAGRYRMVLLARMADRPLYPEGPREEHVLWCWRIESP
jgi:hypothetical protein